jgi:Rrf2 family transcriptional regulator, nitric oxide-sensitive transcriptional repressor
MNKINRKVEYALIGLKHMRSKAPGELTSAKEISQLYGCPFDATSRVMQVLAQKGVLRSEQGAHGGYMITKDLARLSFYDLSEMILGPVMVARCLHDDDGDEPACEMRETCNIVSPVQTLNRRLVEFYRGLSVAELLETRPAVRALLSAEQGVSK